MDNIIGSEEFHMGDTFRIVEIDGRNIFLSRKNNIYLFENKRGKCFLVNLTQQRREKLKELFNV